MKIYLASASPRRREILSALGVRFEVVRSDADESSDEKDPGRLTELLAKRKAEGALIENGEDALVIACDTVVFAEGEILGKPQNAKDAERMLRLLSGKTHSVVSGICLKYGGRTVTAHETTYVKFCEMSDSDIALCMRDGEPMDKAGAYAIQGTASLFIEGIEGDYFNVVGLPTHLLFKTAKNELSLDLL